MEDHYIQNISAIIVLTLAIAGLTFVCRHRFWGPRLINGFKRPFGIIALLIAFGFFSVAWMDSVSWRDALEGENHSFQAAQPRTVLDRLFAVCTGVKEWEYKEKTFSAPLANSQFGDASKTLKYRHLFGTNKTGFDTFYMTLKGCKPAVIIGTLPLLFSIPVALIMGIMAGFFGGFIDEIVVYIYTTISSIPGLLLMIALITALGQGLPQVALGLGVTGWVGLCRLVRAETLKLRELEYIQAATCLGVPTWKILSKHILPNLMHIVIITCILAFTGLVLSESILSYLGIGLDGSWGGMIDNARVEIAQDPVIWWNIISASTALFLLVLSVNVVGDTLRDALDPRTSTQ